MANIKKNFNFRNGVQVDDDNLLVTSTGLVGIGTTVPIEALDVRGNISITGFATIGQANVGFLTISTLEPSQIIGAGVSIKSGIVTAEGTGIVTFFGDASNLLGMPTSQWEDVNIPGLGFTSIYNTGGNVGIATTDPRTTLQIGNQVDAGQKGVGISSVGNIRVSGIITSPSFVGDLTGNVTGNLTGNVTGNVTGNLTGNVTGNTQGIHTGAVDFNDNVKATFGSANEVQMFHKPDTGDFRAEFADTNFVILSRTLDVKNQAGNKATITVFEPGGIPEVRLFNDGNEKLRTTGYGVTIFNQLDTTNLKIAGVSTFSGRIEGAATNNVIPFLYSNMADLPSAGSYHGAVAHVHATGSLYYAHAGQWWELVNKESDGRVGTGTEIYNVSSINSSGIITAATELNTPLIGVGTDLPANPIQVRGTGNTEIQITSDTGIAGLTVGREGGTGNTNNAEFRYGGGSGFTYSSAQSLDILNYGTGNFNYHLSANNGGAADGSFFWHLGNNNSRLMTLTSTGRLGIGITQPTDELHVIGGTTVSGDITVGNNVTVTGTVIGNLQGTVTGNVAGTLAGNTNTTVGISTLNNLSVAGIATIISLESSQVGIGTTVLENQVITVNDGASSRFFVTNTGEIGLKQSSPSPLNDADAPLLVDISAGNCSASFKALGVGISKLGSAVDFSNAGVSTARFMIPPKVNTSGRNSLQNVVAGAVIYNTSTNKLQVFNGSAWQDCN